MLHENCNLTAYSVVMNNQFEQYVYLPSISSIHECVTEDEPSRIVMPTNEKPRRRRRFEAGAKKYCFVFTTSC